MVSSLMGWLRRPLAVGTAGAVIGAAAGAAAVAEFGHGARSPEQAPGRASAPRTAGSAGAAASGTLDTALLRRALAIVKARYFSAAVDYHRLSQGALRGMVASLADPYSYFLTPAQYTRLAQQDSGRYSGVGIYLSQGTCASHPVVAGIVPGSPAQRHGVRTGDVVLGIDGHSTSAVHADQAAADIRGPTGTVVRLRLRQAGHTFTVALKRADVTVPTVASVRLGQVLYLRVYEFDSSTASDFLARLEKGLPGARGVVLDLRDNGGGLLAAATAVIGDFVSRGVALELTRRNMPPTDVAVTGGHPAGLIPVVVLVNSNTASAAEIVAGSLAAHHRAKLVGTRTYGKGSVQGDFLLPGGADLHLTTQRWLLPGGRSVDRTGLSPDIAVSLPPGAQMFDPAHPQDGHATDTQLNRALALLSTEVRR